MKINFSNLAKLFLAGVCFVAVGCTDYGQDIDNLRTEMNDRFEDLESNTIDPLKADLDATKNALAAAQAAIDAHATQHAADIAALQAKDAELDARITEEANKAAKALADKAAELQAAFEAADANLKSELKADLAALSAELVAKAAELQNNIAVVDAKTQANAEAIVKTAQDAAAALAALQAQLEKADKDLEDRLKAADTALAEALRAELATESKKITDMIAAEVESLNNKLAQAVAEFNAALAKTDANVAKNAADILANASNISANSDAIKANADAIAKNADAIAANAAAIEALANTANKAIEDVKASVAATQALLEQQLADAKNELLLAIQEGDKAVQDALLAEIATLEGTLTGKIDSLKSELVDKIANLDTELTGKIDGLKSELNTKIDDLESQLNAKIDTSIAELDVKLNAAVDRLNADVAKNASAIAALQESLEAAVATLEETIATTKAELEKAVKDGDEALAKQIAEVSATLTQALADAVTELTKQMEDYVAALQSQINQINSEISALKTTDADLQNQINALEAALNTTNAAVKKNAENIAGLDAGLKQAVADLTKRDDMLKADMDKMYAYFDDCVNGLKTITSSLRNDLDGHIAAYGLFKAEVEGHLAKLDAQIVELMAKDAAIEKLIADLTARVDANEALLKDVEALAKQNQSDIAQNAADIKANKQLFDEYVLATDKTLEDLKAADAALAAVDAALQASIEDLNVRFTAYQNEIRAELDQHYGDFAKYQSEVEAKFAEVETKFTIQQAKIDANTEAIAKNAEAIAKNVEAIANNEKAIAGNGKLIEQNASAIAQNQTDIAQIKLDIAKNVDAIAKNAMDILTNAGNIANNSAAIAANTAKIEAAKAELAQAIAGLDEKYKGITDVLSSRLSALEKAHADLAQAHEKLANEFAEYQLEVAAVFASIEAAQLEQDGKIKLNADQIAALQTQLGNLTTTVENIYKTLTERIDNLEASLTQSIEKVSADLNALKGRIQSLVFVPEYSDGKATIEYARFGNSVVECESKFLYQVYPAECVAAIKPADLQFVFTEALKTRAAEPMLEIVAVNTKNADKGIFEVVAKAHHLHAIYEGSKEYAVSLVFNGKSSNTETNIASCYTNLIAERADDVTKITWELNDGYKKTEELEYIATGSVNVLGGIDYIFYENDIKQSHDYIFEHYGLTVKPVEIAPTYNNDEYTSALDASTKASKNVFKNVVREDHGYDVSIALPKPDKNTVGLVQTIGYGFNLITVNDNAVVDNLSDYATVEITKIKGYLTLDPQTITWARSKDNEADGITPINPTTRLVATVAGKLLNLNGEELTTAGTTYADIIADPAKLQSITVNGAAIATPYNVVLGGTNDEPTVLFEGFEWDKEYTIVASYEIDNMIAQISIVLTTVQKDSVVTLDPATITWNYAADKKSEPAYAGTDKETTFRAVEVKADNADLYADVIANGKLVKITPDAGFVFTAAGIEATGFAWNQPYAVEALYAIEEQLVTVKVAVETVKADFVELPISLEAAQWMLTAGFVNQSETPDEALLPVYEGLTNLGNITAEDYLKDIFVIYPATVDVNTANGETKAVTKLEVAADGQTIKSVYGLDDFSTVPAAIDYELAVTTWYGQKIKFTKNLNIGLKPVTIVLADSDVTVSHLTEYHYGNALNKAAALKVLEDPQQTIFAQVKAHGTVAEDVVEADFLKKTLVANKDNHYAMVDTYLFNKTNSKVATTTTNVAISDDGLVATAQFLYIDVPVMPQTITHVYDVTTWYGQKITIEKTVNFHLTKDYNFWMVPEWVYADKKTGYYYSKVLGEYDYYQNNFSSLNSFNTKNVDMSTAFDVRKGGAEGMKLVYANPTTAQTQYPLLSDNHLTMSFELEDAGLASKFVNYVLEYQDYDRESVPVIGRLYFNANFGNEVKAYELTTNFTTDVNYAQYVVKRHDFLAQPTAKPMNLVIANAKTYKVQTLAFIDAMDIREYPATSHSLIQYTVAGETFYSCKDAVDKLEALKLDIDYNNISAKINVGDDVHGFMAMDYGNGVVHNALASYSGLVIRSYMKTELPSGLINKVRYEEASHELVVDASAQLNLTKPQPIEIVVDFEYVGRVYRSTTLTITLKELSLQ